MKTVTLFSYPRSGNTWLRYIIEVLTGRPTLGTPDNLKDDIPFVRGSMACRLTRKLSLRL